MQSHIFLKDTFNNEINVSYHSLYVIFNIFLYIYFWTMLFVKTIAGPDIQSLLRINYFPSQALIFQNDILNV